MGREGFECHGVRPSHLGPSLQLLIDIYVFRTPFFFGVIPSGQSFNINSTFSGSGFSSTGFSWTVPVNAETDLILLSGDEHAIGTGGYVDYKVQPPSSTSATTCFTSMPSATSGVPAGGYPNGATSSTVPNMSVCSFSLYACARLTPIC